MTGSLVKAVPPSIEKVLVSMLSANESIFVKLKGAFKEVLICTDNRVIILKSGAMTGQWMGLNQFQIPLTMVSSAEVNATLGCGYIEVSAGGVQNTAKSYWNGSARKAPNCVSIVGESINDFRTASSLILERAATARSLKTGHASSLEADRAHISETLMSLWKMRSEGALTEEEFEAAKARVING